MESFDIYTYRKGDHYFFPFLRKIFPSGKNECLIKSIINVKIRDGEDEHGKKKKRI